MVICIKSAKMRKAGAPSAVPTEDVLIETARFYHAHGDYHWQRYVREGVAENSVKQLPLFPGNVKKKKKPASGSRYAGRRGAGVVETFFHLPTIHMTEFPGRWPSINLFLIRRQIAIFG